MDGIIVVNKPEGITSQGVVSRVKKFLNTKKAGHAGTLDPLACGVLIVMVGNATKLSKYLIEHNKSYIATIKLGEKSSTGDREGEIIEKKKIPDLTKELVEEALNSFLGKQTQIPPTYSAIKVNGKKLYEYARCGEEVEVPSREIEIYNIKLLDLRVDEIDFKVECSKGTYIRTLCQDIAEKLDTVGFMKALNRVTLSNFSIEESYTLEQIEKGEFKLITQEEICKFPEINLNKRKVDLFLNGVNLTNENQDGLYNVYENGEKYIGTGIIQNNLLKRDVII